MVAAKDMRSEPEKEMMFGMAEKEVEYRVELFNRELLDLMQSGKLEPEAAFLNASLVPDVFPVLAVAHRALLFKSRESLTTRTLHSELVYNYSSSKHITESLK